MSQSYFHETTTIYFPALKSDIFIKCPPLNCCGYRRRTFSWFIRPHVKITIRGEKKKKSNLPPSSEKQEVTHLWKDTKMTRVGVTWLQFYASMEKKREGFPQQMLNSLVERIQSRFSFSSLVHMQTTSNEDLCGTCLSVTLPVPLVQWHSKLSENFYFYWDRFRGVVLGFMLWTLLFIAMLPNVL